MRGQSVKVQRSLRTRVVAASALAFLGLSAVVCLVLPRAYEAQANSAFQDRVTTTARGVAATLGVQLSPDGTALDPVTRWLASDPAFVAVVLVDANGRAIDRWPDSAGSFGALPDAGGTSVHVAPNGTVAVQPLRPGDPSSPWVAVRYSTVTLVRDFENVRWLFASLFLFTSVVFFILTNYLTRTILQPLEEIGRAAMCLADGEPVVQVPTTGDREIDDLGQFIAKLGESRRQSRVMTSPHELLAARRWGREGRPSPDPDATAAPMSAPSAPAAGANGAPAVPDAPSGDARNPL